MEFYSPLRYPGGKGKVANYFKDIFAQNSLYDGVYIEPYAGGASVALSLLFNEYASRIIINDIDRSIFSFWHAVLNQTEELCRLISDTQLNIENWERQREVQRRKAELDTLEVGFSTFYLNRTNRSGILNAGIIGGRQQNGNWLMDARFNRADLIKRIKRIATYNDSIQLHNEDAVQLVNRLRTSLPANSLFYFDPPYYVKGKDLYLNFYNNVDHENIATEIEHIDKQRWIVTYDDVEFIKNLYQGHRLVEYSLNYSAGEASKGKEVMIYSDNLLVHSLPND